MRLKTRIHEWLADHFESIQYPNVTLIPERGRFRFRYLSGKQKWWLAVFTCWGLLILMSIYGNLI